MTELYQLNELNDNQSPSIQKANNYVSDINNDFAMHIFIKAINKTIEKVNESISIRKQLGENMMAIPAENSQLMIDFLNNLDLASKIVTEFQQSTSILYTDIPELINLFEILNQTFIHLKIKINMFSITKNLKYAYEAIINLNSAHKAFASIQNITK